VASRRHVPAVDRADGLDAADGVGEEDLVGSEQVVEREMLFAYVLSPCACQLDRSPAGDAGDDAPIGRGREEGACADREDVCPRGLEDRAVGVDQQGHLAGVGTCGEAVDQLTVGPLVRTEAAGGDEAAQGESAVGGGKYLCGVNLGGGDGRLDVSGGSWHDRDPQFSLADSARALVDRSPGAGGQRDAEEGRDARRQALDVRVDLDRVPVEDEQGLENAPRGVGMGRTAHGGDILTPMRTESEVTGGTLGSSSQLLVRQIDGPVDAERAVVHLFGNSMNAFWLDSSAPGERGRFSFAGDASGPLGAIVTYDVEDGLLRIESEGGREVRRESIFDFLARALPPPGATAPGLPFDFDCGFAGYLGYELKAECGGEAAHSASTPDAAFVFADRLIAFDHWEGHAYLLALIHPPSELHQIPYLPEREFDAVRSAEAWLDETERQLEALPPLPGPEPQGPVELRSRRSPGRYLDDVAACKRCLEAGDSYEICLTDQLEGEGTFAPLDLYRSLRRVNPAPFAAYLRLGDLAVLSSSPERFLAVDREGWAETRPIKGTSRRGVGVAEDRALGLALREDPKSRAENVTIVDLARNDLGRVCDEGSVEVSELARVETYETVHQLVSGVRGRLRGRVSAAGCVKACFPPGSMTGAPKLRTMEILDELEGGPRGVYSGAIGYFGLGGACDLSVAIRTIVLDGRRVSIGAGGAIVADSDPGEELAEMLLKAGAPAAALSGVGLAGRVAEPRDRSIFVG